METITYDVGDERVSFDVEAGRFVTEWLVIPSNGQAPIWVLELDYDTAIMAGICEAG